jgi:hypothetical protein
LEVTEIVVVVLAVFEADGRLILECDDRLLCIGGGGGGGVEESGKVVTVPFEEQINREVEE